jgi:hypothetical protein
VKKLKNIKLVMVVMSICALTLTGCGGGGSSNNSGGTPTALKVADKVSVVDAQSEDGGAGASAVALSLGFQALSVSALPANSDYYNDPSFTYVEERSAEGFEIINEILCYMSQTRYEDMLNKGDFKAQIDVGQCDKERDSASSAGQSSQNQSSGSNMTAYQLWTVNSSRTNSNTPHIVKAWFTEEPDEMDPAMIFAIKVEITEGVSATNPYGLFTLNFKSTSADGSQTYFTGNLKSEIDSSTGLVLLKFFNDGNVGGGSFVEKVTLQRSADGSSGAGSTYTNEGTIMAYDMNYNDSYFFRSDGSQQVCLDRTNPDVTAWRYGMYYDENHATPGKRVTVNSGFPIKYTDGNETYHGWAGFYGLWLPGEASVSHGDTLYKQDYSQNGSTETPYTVFMSGGKLNKHTKKTLTLGEVANVPLNWHDCDQQGCSEYRVEWDSTAEQLNKTAERDNATWVWKDLSPAQQVVFDSQAWDFNFWSESLGGNGRINLKDPTDPTGAAQITLTNSTTIVFHVQDTIYPGDSNIPANLACFENCLHPSAVNSSAPFFTNTTWDSQNSLSETNMNVDPANLVADTHYIPYTFDSSTMELQYNSTAVVMTDSSNNEHGAWTGALIEPTTQNFAALACDWDSSKTCTWQAWDSLDVFYTWETGTQQWNKLTALQDGNGFVSFDPPISVEYTHTWGDSSTSKFYLEYNGFGDIHGIPGKCVDMDTGLDTDCWDASGEKYIRWVPEYTIPNGSVLTDAVSGDTFYAKALEKEERMKAVSVSQCTNSGLSIQSYDLPDGSDYVEPDIGARPAVAGAPAVIGGVLQ